MDFVDRRLLCLKRFHRVREIEFAQYVIEGEARVWFQWRQSMLLFQSWEEVKDLLLLKFGNEEDPYKIRLRIEREQIIHEFRVCSDFTFDM